MSATHQGDHEDPRDAQDVAQAEDAAGDERAGADDEQPTKLNLAVSIIEHGACQRHVTVTVPREDIERYYDKEFSELVTTAQVPGFRQGRAPRKLVEQKFRKDVAGRVKTALLMDSIAQVSDDKSLSAISEPDFNPDSVVLPDAGPMTFEFDLEVRPEFDVPQWKGLELEKPVREFTEEDVDRALQNLLARRGRLSPKDGPAASGDYISANLTFKHENQVVSKAQEELIRLRPVLSFRDGKLEGFDKLMEGVRGGESRTGEATIGPDAPNVALRGKTVSVIFDVLDVKQLDTPELTAQFLDDLGGFQSEAELRDEIKQMLQRRLQYRQRQEARDQITRLLTAAANWDLPPDLLRRQSHRELQRTVLELQRSGFSPDEIQAHENELRQNSMASTARALKEHFILERIAEDEGIDPVEADYDEEIAAIAQQTNESPRRVRARLDKGGMMDVLRNQVVERKVIDLILSQATFKEVAYEPEAATQTEAIDQSAGGGTEESEIPEAQAESGSGEYTPPGSKPEA